MAAAIRRPRSARELLGNAAAATLPAAGSRDEIELARAITARLEAILVRPSRRSMRPQSTLRGRRRLLRDRLTWLVLRPGRLDRDG